MSEVKKGRRVEEMLREDQARREQFVSLITQRQPPHNLQAEQALLGALMANNRAYDRVALFLRPEHFIDPTHAAIYAEIQIAIESGRLADALTLNDRFRNTDVLADVGGTAYLAQLLTAMVGIMNAGEYGRAIYDAWVRRQLIDAAAQLFTDAYTGDTDTRDRAALAVSRIDSAIEAQGASNRPTGRMLIDAVDAALTNADEAASRGGPIGLSTGFPALDKKLLGLRDGNFYVLAGRPGMGKSALAMGIAENTARFCVEDLAEKGEKSGVLFVSLEMSDEDLATRSLASHTGMPSEKLLTGQHEPYVDELLAARDRLSNIPLLIEDVPGIRMAEIRLKCRAAQRRLGRLRLIIIDHLHIVRPEAGESGAWAVGQISNAMKRLAKEFNCPVVALAQLNREVEKRDDKRPTQADLRYAGEIEQDADVIAFIYREEYYLEKTPLPERKHGESITIFNDRLEADTNRRSKAANKAEIIIDKNRQGKTGTVLLKWNGPTTSFADWDR